MKPRLTRREALKIALMGSLAAACSPQATTEPAAAPTRIAVTPTPFPTSQPAPAANTEAPAATAPAAPTEIVTAVPTEDARLALIANNTAAANAFLASLGESQVGIARYAFEDAERVRWHWTTPRGFPRNGLSLKAMDQSQRDLALALLHSGSSDYGFQKALDIIALQNDLGNDPELYYVTIFGEPGGAAPWGWRFEGHHLSRHITIVGDQISVMPFFLGAWPTVSAAGLKAMEREEWAAREIMNSMDEGHRAIALFQERSLTQHVTWNQPYVSPLEPVGLPVGEFNADQQALVLEVLQTYLGTLPGGLGSVYYQHLTDAGLENVQFGWAGPLEPQRPHYYRLQGPTFLLEFDNSRNGGIHIHSVWRDFAEDFGQNLA